LKYAYPGDHTNQNKRGGEQNPRELEDIPDPREIIEITFGDSINALTLDSDV
jgi:hypothetical protein